VFGKLAEQNVADVCGIRLWHWVNVKLTSISILTNLLGSTWGKL